jgi:hypothetical protein
MVAVSDLCCPRFRYGVVENKAVPGGSFAISTSGFNLIGGTEESDGATGILCIEPSGLKDPSLCSNPTVRAGSSDKTRPLTNVPRETVRHWSRLPVNTIRIGRTARKGSLRCLDK